MNYLKMFAAAAVAAVALMAFAGDASATTLTVRNGDVEETVAGTTTLLSSIEGGTETTFNGSFGQIKCRQSILEVRLTNPGSATETVEGFVNGLTFGFCNGQVQVLAKGFMEIHTEGAAANGNGTVTSSVAQITVELSGIHCIYTTVSTDLGTMTGAHGTGSVIINIASAAIPKTGGKSGVLCGNSMTWKGIYSVTNLAAGEVNFRNFTVD